MKHRHRLPDHIFPERYRLVLRPDFEGFLFSGDETIYLRLKKKADKIVLHAKELEILHVQFRATGHSLTAKKIEYDKKTETAVLSFGKRLPRGRAELDLKFNGILNNKMRGFYRSRYLHAGEEKHLATTQFEATDARSAFPCIDEPAAKAIFDVTLIVPETMTAISNTIETRVAEHGAGYKLVEFAPTPKMSTYLLAFIVGDFEFIEGRTGRGVLVRVFTTPGKKHQAKFALSCAVRTLDFYEKYFDIRYPLPVLDMIAIPDFTSGAMENWGAITYRESALLVDEENSSAVNRQWVALVIAHEIAHQWFGNLVTMHWWTDLWLNEGFASYIEYLAVDKLFPDWKIWTQFCMADLGPAMKLDALANTHPVEVPVRHPSEIGEIFDAVSYSKGASVIRMLANFLGEQKFRQGLRHYLKKHSYGNTKTSDLWRALEKVSGRPVMKIMQAWTKKPGYPIIRVFQRPAGLYLSQMRYFSSRVSKNNFKDETCWQIPLYWQTKKDIFKTLMPAKTFCLKYKTSGNAWVKLNCEESSLVRVDYPSQMLEAMKKPIADKTLGVLNRLGIIRDAFALAESGDLPTPQALGLALVYKNESEYAVWNELAEGYFKIGSLLSGIARPGIYEKYGRDLFADAAKRLGWMPKHNEAHQAVLLRSLLISALGRCGHGPTVLRAKKLFRAHFLLKKKIPADLRSAVYQIAAENGTKSDFKFLRKAYITEELNEEKNRLGRAMGQFRQKKLLLDALNFAFSDQVRTQDLPGILVSVWQNPHGRDLAWLHVQKHIGQILDRFALGGHMLSRILAAAGSFALQDKATEIENFFRLHPAPEAKRTIQQVAEKIRSNAEWLRDEAESIQKWLSSKYEM